MLSPREYLDNYWDGNLPVNMVSIANKLGVAVLEGDNLQNYFAALLYKNNKPIIVVNKKEANIRKRFILTHALLDYLSVNDIYQGTQDKNKVSYYGKENCMLNNSSSYNEAINRRVMDFLIPQHILEFVIVQKNITELNELSNLFGVSEALMAESIKKFTHKIGIKL